MRASYVTHLLLCALLAVPAITLQDQDPRSLRGALEATILTLEEWTRVEARVALRDPAAIGEVLELTEPPIAEAMSRDAELERLRRDVSALEMRLEIREQASDVPAHEGVNGPVLQVPGRRTTGLDDAQRSSLAQAEPRPTAGAPAPARTGGPAVALEPSGYAADPLRLASACYRAGEYEKALEALANRKDSGGRYWRARNLERLGRIEEAMAELEQVSKTGDDAELASRAKEELEFLRWRAGLKIPSRAERKESSP